MTKAKRTRKPKDTELTTYEMMENLCESQHRYITQRDKLLDHYRASNERLMESNLRLQRRNGQLLKTNEDQFDNFKLVAQQAIQMWHKMEESGQFEDFLEEKINLNTEQLMKDVEGKTEH